MTEQEFLEKRKQFYIESDTLLFRFPNSKHLNSTHAQWYADFNIPWQFSIRGYLWETEDHDDDHIMLYWNNYGIPNITCNVFSVIFNQFPLIKWIGLGCYIGKKGDIWEPQMKVYNNNVV